MTRKKKPIVLLETYPLNQDDDDTTYQTETNNGVTIRHGNCNSNGKPCPRNEQASVDREACNDDEHPEKEKACLKDVACFYDEDRCEGVTKPPTTEPCKSNEHRVGGICVPKNCHEVRRLKMQAQQSFVVTMITIMIITQTLER
jgi:hypothetical protein